MSSRARKLAIIGKTDPVPETASLLADALEGVMAGLCQIAAGMHTKTLEDQRRFAGVLFEDANTRFADVLRKLEPQQKEELARYISSICKNKR